MLRNCSRNQNQKNVVANQKANMKGKTRKKKTDTPPIPYVKYDTDDIWNMIENGINPQDELDSYDTSAEDIR